MAKPEKLQKVSSQLTRGGSNPAIVMITACSTIDALVDEVIMLKEEVAALKARPAAPKRKKAVLKNADVSSPD